MQLLIFAHDSQQRSNAVSCHGIPLQEQNLYGKINDEVGGISEK
jgi:hypothetical protein